MADWSWQEAGWQGDTWQEAGWQESAGSEQGKGKKGGRGGKGGGKGGRGGKGDFRPTRLKRDAVRELWWEQTAGTISYAVWVATILKQSRASSSSTAPPVESEAAAVVASSMGFDFEGDEEAEFAAALDTGEEQAAAGCTDLL